MSAEHASENYNARLLVRSAPTSRLDGGDIDFLHRHHRVEGTPCFIATSGQRVGQRAWGDLPGESPAVLAPTTSALRPAVCDDRIPVALCLFLIVRRDLERKGLAVLNTGPPLIPRQGMPRTVNSTVSTSPFLPPG